MADDAAGAPPATTATDELARRWAAPAEVTAAAVAVVAVAAWILWDARSTARGTRFISQPQFVLWLLILCAQAVVWTLAAVPVWSVVRHVGRELRAQRALGPKTLAGVALAALFVLLLGVVFSVPSGLVPSFGSLESLSRSLRQLPDKDQWPLPHHTLKISVLVSLGFVVGLTAIVGLWLIGIAFHRMALVRARPTSDVVERFLRLRDELNLLLAVVGVIVGLGTLSTGALRNAVLVQRHHHAVFPLLKFPPEYVLMFGLYYSGLLAVAYLPTYLALRRAGEHLREEAFPLVSPSSENFSERLAQRNAFGRLLQLDVSASSSFKAAVAIFTPLAGSLVGLVLGTK